MTFKYQPVGLPLSSSYAVSASAVLSVTTVPATASYAEYVLAPAGPTGSAYVTVSGSVT